MGGYGTLWNPADEGGTKRLGLPRSWWSYRVCEAPWLTPRCAWSFGAPPPHRAASWDPEKSRPGRLANAARFALGWTKFEFVGLWDAVIAERVPARRSGPGRRFV